MEQVPCLMFCPSCAYKYDAQGAYDMENQVWIIETPQCPSCGENGLLSNGAGYVRTNTDAEQYNQG